MADGASFQNNTGKSSSDTPTAAPGMSALEIRTMRDDLARIRSGQMPQPRKSDSLEISAPETPQEPTTPFPPPPIPPTPQVEPPPITLPSTPPLEPPQSLPTVEEPEQSFALPSAPALDANELDLLSHLDSTMPEPLTTAPQPPPEPHDAFSPVSPMPLRESGLEDLLPQELRIEESPTTTPSASPSDLPLRPEELLALEEEVAQVSGDRGRGIGFTFPKIPRIVFLAGGAVLVIALVAFGATTYFRSRPEPIPAPPPSITPTVELQEPEVPSPLIPIGATSTITVPNINEGAVALAQIFREPTPEEVLRRILVKLETETERRYFTFDELTEALGITVSSDAYDALDTTQYMMFLYGEPGVGARVGLVAATRDAAALRSTMTAREIYLAEDFDTLLRSIGEKGLPAKDVFSTTTRRGLTNRYLNFSEPTLSIDYAIDPVRHLLLFATSRVTMYAAIDALP